MHNAAGRTAAVAPQVEDLLPRGQDDGAADRPVDVDAAVLRAVPVVSETVAEPDGDRTVGGAARRVPGDRLMFAARRRPRRETLGVADREAVQPTQILGLRTVPGDHLGRAGLGGRLGAVLVAQRSGCIAPPRGVIRIRRVACAQRPGGAWRHALGRHHGVPRMIVFATARHPVLPSPILGSAALCFRPKFRRSGARAGKPIGRPAILAGRPGGNN